jgi:hypothetical protein
MPAILLKILLWASTSVQLREFVISVLSALAKKSDTFVDDMFVDAAAAALDIRIPDEGAKPSVPKDGNIFVADKTIDEIKADYPRAVRISKEVSEGVDNLEVSAAIITGLKVGETARPMYSRGNTRRKQ